MEHFHIHQEQEKQTLQARNKTEVFMLESKQYSVAQIFQTVWDFYSPCKLVCSHSTYHFYPLLHYSALRTVMEAKYSELFDFYLTVVINNA